MSKTISSWVRAVELNVICTFKKLLCCIDLKSSCKMEKLVETAGKKMLKALRDERRRNRKKCDGAEAAERAKTENTT